MAVGVICLLSFNDFAFALQPGTVRRGIRALSPATRFRTIQGDGFVTLRDTASGTDFTQRFKGDAGLVYVSRLIGKVLAASGSVISANGLKALIRRHLSHLGPVSFKWESLYKEGKTFCLPYVDEGGHIKSLRYYRPDDNPAEASGKVSIPVGTGDVRVVFEDIRALPGEAGPVTTGAFTPEELFDELSRFLSFPKDLSRTMPRTCWQKDITPQDIVDFYNYIDGCGDFSPVQKEYYFHLLLLNIIVSTLEISFEGALKPLRDLCLLDDREAAARGHAAEFVAQTKLLPSPEKVVSAIFELLNSIKNGIEGAMDLTFFNSFVQKCNYLSDTAAGVPVAGRRRSPGKKASLKEPAEKDKALQMAVVDEMGRPTGEVKTKYDMHNDGEGSWHRSSFVLIFDANGRVLRQRRSSRLSEGPGKYEVSLSGHVGYYEDYERCILKRMASKLGLVYLPGQKLIRIGEEAGFSTDADPEDREVSSIYIYFKSEDIVPRYDKAEIAGVSWIEFDKVLDDYRKHGDKYYSRALDYICARPGVIENIRQIVAEHKNKKSHQSLPPSGSPYRIFEILQAKLRGYFATAGEIQRYTEGRMPGGHLSVETIRRDLEILHFLGLTVKNGKGLQAAHRAVYLSSSEQRFVETVLAELGTRPTARQKREAKEQLKAAGIRVIRIEESKRLDLINRLGKMPLLLEEVPEELIPTLREQLMEEREPLIDSDVLVKIGLPAIVEGMDIEKKVALLVKLYNYRGMAEAIGKKVLCALDMIGAEAVLQLVKLLRSKDDALRYSAMFALDDFLETSGHTIPRLKKVLAGKEKEGDESLRYVAEGVIETIWEAFLEEKDFYRAEFIIKILIRLIGEGRNDIRGISRRFHPYREIDAWLESHSAELRKATAEEEVIPISRLSGHVRLERLLHLAYLPWWGRIAYDHGEHIVANTWVDGRGKFWYCKRPRAAYTWPGIVAAHLHPDRNNPWRELIAWRIGENIVNTVEVRVIEEGRAYLRRLSVSYSPDELLYSDPMGANSAFLPFLVLLRKWDERVDQRAPVGNSFVGFDHDQAFNRNWLDIEKFAAMLKEQLSVSGVAGQTVPRRKTEFTKIDRDAVDRSLRKLKGLDLDRLFMDIRKEVAELAGPDNLSEAMTQVEKARQFLQETQRTLEKDVNTVIETVGFEIVPASSVGDIDSSTVFQVFTQGAVPWERVTKEAKLYMLRQLAEACGKAPTALGPNDFSKKIRRFGHKSLLGLLDWAKREFGCRNSRETISRLLEYLGVERPEWDIWQRRARHSGSKKVSGDAGREGRGDTEEGKYSKRGQKAEKASHKRSKPPVIALIKGESGWKQYELSPEQHDVINGTYRALRSKEYKLNKSDEIVQDVRDKLSPRKLRIPVHIHSPPQEVFYDKLYRLAEKSEVFFPPRECFRLITHPGTYREKKTAAPRSYNLLIPAEELGFLKDLRRKDKEAYRQWLNHEAEHLMDRAYSAIGREESERKLAQEYPIGKLLEAYNAEAGVAFTSPGRAEYTGVPSDYKPWEEDGLIGAATIIRLFPEKDIPWDSTTKAAKLLMFNELARILGKEPGFLNTRDFYVSIARFHGKTLSGLLNWAKRRYKCKDNVEALNALREHLGIEEEYIDETMAIQLFKEGHFLWERATKRAKLFMVRELARIRGKSPGALNTKDFYAPIDEFDGKAFNGLLAWAKRKFASRNDVEAVTTLKEYLGIEEEYIGEREVLQLFKGGELSWERTTKEARLFMFNELAGSLNKSAFALTTYDFNRKIPALGNKTLSGLLRWAKREFKCRKTGEALEALKEHLLDGKKPGRPVRSRSIGKDQVLELFKQGRLSWGEVTKSTKLYMVRELARICHKKPGALNVNDFYQRRPEFSKNFAQLLKWARREFDCKGDDEEALIRLKRHLGIRDLIPPTPALEFSHENWDVTERIFERHGRPLAGREHLLEIRIEDSPDMTIRNDIINHLQIDARNGNYASYCVLSAVVERWFTRQAKKWNKKLRIPKERLKERFYDYEKMLDRCIVRYDGKGPFLSYLYLRLTARFKRFLEDRGVDMKNSGSRDKGGSGTGKNGPFGPVIALIKEKDRWLQCELSPDQHGIINQAWAELWDKGYGLTAADEIVREIKDRLDSLGLKMPVHIHSPPRKVFYDKVYGFARVSNISFPPRERFRLITHPGAYRDRQTGAARSCNMLIPQEELLFLKSLKQREPAAYRQWLNHEIAHLADRANRAVGTEKPEQCITEEYPIDEFLTAYNARSKEKINPSDVLDGYFKELKRLSVSGEGIVSDDIYFPGNELLYQANIEGTFPGFSVKDKGGTFIGTGCGAALEYIFHSGAKNAYIIDHNLFVTEVIWPIMFVLYTENEDRLDFFQELLSVEFTPEERRFLRDKGAADIVRFAHRLKRDPGKKFKASVARFVSLLGPYASPEVRPRLKSVVGSFFHGFLSGKNQHRFWSDAFFPIFQGAALLRSNIDLLGGTLSSQETFEKTRDIICGGRLKIVTGDWTGEGFKRVSEDISSQGEKVSMVYASNIPTIIGPDFTNPDPQPYIRLFDNLKSLPLADSALILRATHGTLTCPNQLLSEFMTIGIDTALSSSSEHSVRYRILLSRELMTCLYSFYSPGLSVNKKVNLIHGAYCLSSAGEEDSRRADERAQTFFSYIDRVAWEDGFEAGQFKDRYSFKDYLAEKGITEIDPFDYEMVCTAFEIIGIIGTNSGRDRTARRGAENYVDPGREIKAAQTFIDAVIVQAYEAGTRGENVIIGIDTSWIPDMQGLQPLVNEICRLSQLDNIVVIRESGKELAALIEEERKRTGTRLSNIVVLGSEDTVKSHAFDWMRSTEADRDRACLVGVNPERLKNPEDPAGSTYIRLLEMLTMALELAFSRDSRLDTIVDTLKANHPFVDIRVVGHRAFTFIPLPDAVPLDLGELKKIYEKQREVISAA